MKPMLRAATVMVLLGAGVTGCATMPNPIAETDRAGLHVAAVDLTWEVEDGDRPATQSYELEKRDLQSRMHQDIMQSFDGEPSGPIPVDIKVHVTRYTRVGALMGNIVGGVNAVAADVDVVRESDGRVVGTYNAVYGMYASNHGLIGAIAQSVAKPDITGIMADTFAANLTSRFWGKSSFAFRPTRRTDVVSPTTETPAGTPIPVAHSTALVANPAMPAG